MEKEIKKEIEKLSNMSWTVRENAVYTLGRLQAKEAIPHLIKALKDEEKYVRLAAISALSELQAQEAIPHLIILLSEDEETIVRADAVYTLGRLQAKEAIPHLIKALKDEEFAVRYAAAKVISKTDKDLIRKSLSNKDAFIRESAAYALGELQAQEAIPELISLLSDESSDVKLSTIQVCNELQARYELEVKKAIPELIKLLSEMI